MNKANQFRDGMREMLDCTKMLENNVQNYSYQAVVELCQRIMEQAEMINHDAAVRAYGIAYFYLGKSAHKELYLKESSEYFLKSISYLQEAGEVSKLIEAYSLLGEYFGAGGNSVNAIECLLKVVEIGSGVDDFQVAKALLHIGNNCMIYYNGEKAFEYYCKAEEQFVICKRRNTESYLRAILGLAFSMYHQGKMEEAMSYLTKAKDSRVYLNSGKYPVLESTVIELLIEDKDVKSISSYMAQYSEVKISAATIMDIEITSRMIINEMLLQHKYDIAGVMLSYLEKFVHENRHSKEYSWWLEKVSLEIQNQEAESFSVIEQGRKYLLHYEEVSKLKASNFKQMLKIEEELDAIERKKVELVEVRRSFGGESLYDTMTKLPNRLFLNDYIEGELGKAKVTGETFTVGIVDIDYLENLNRNYGHLEGDKAIVRVAEAIQEICAGDLLCGRYSGDEFVLIGRGMTYKRLLEIVKGIRKRIEHFHIQNDHDGVNQVLTVSQGYYINVPTKNELMWEYLSRADTNVYRVKRNNRDGYYVEKGDKYTDNPIDHSNPLIY